MVRMIKWVGEPSILFADGFTVANWKHEDHRSVAVMGHATKKINHHKFPGLGRTYHWGGQPGKKKVTMADMIQPVDELDWNLIHEQFPYEFKDVTDHPHPELVENDPVIVHRDPSTGQWFKSR